jgi:hypothetical protein
MKTFETLDAFQRAVELMVQVYRTTPQFPVDERYGLTSQATVGADCVRETARDN